MTLWHAVYRFALRALPAELRAKHGPAMESLFVREIEAAGRAGFGRRPIAALRGIADAVRRGLYERLRHGPPFTSSEDQPGPAGSHRVWSVEAVAQDVSHSVGALRKAPRFTAVVVVTLGLAIGANSAIFSVVDAVLLRPLPFPDAGRVVGLAWDGGTHVQTYLSAMKFDYWREHASALDAVATWKGFHAEVGVDDDASRLTGLRVSEDFFEVVGYAPALGRTFTAAEFSASGDDVALVSWSLWQLRFGGDPDVTGRAVRVDGRTHTIVGVLARNFDLPQMEVDGPVSIVVPLALTVDPRDEAQNWPTIARLGGDVSRDEAQVEIAALGERFESGYPDLVGERDRGMMVASFGQLYVGETARALWLLMGSVGLVLLIACANVANLFLARATKRRGQIALLAALGATRARIVRMVLAECVVVALAAAALGLAMAKWVVQVMVALAPSRLPRLETVAIDWRVLLFTSIAALGAAILFGGAAALPALRTRLSDVLEDGARGSSGRGLVRPGLLVVQSAIAMVLLSGAGLLVVTLANLARLDAGFEPDPIVAARLPVRPDDYRTSRDLWTLQQRVADALRDAPAVASIASATNLPLERGVNFPMTIGGRPDDFEGAIEWRAITPDYFQTLEIPVLTGRAFSSADEDAAPPVAIVNEAFVRRYFPDGDPLGQRVEIGRFRGEFLSPSLAGPGVEIVGVVGDVREIDLRTEPRRTVYVPQAQAPSAIANVLGTMPVFMVRPRPGAAGVEQALVDAFRSADPALPRPEIFPLSDVVARSLARERFGAALLSAFAGLALGLTAFGVHSALAYSVRQRYREIGIRMALGADGGAVRRMVLREGVVPVGTGLVVGAGIYLPASRVVAGYLWGVTPTDPTTLGAVAALLVTVAITASWMPATEAIRLDPVTTLRSR